jgi:hypothetical protein
MVLAVIALAFQLGPSAGLAIPAAAANPAAGAANGTTSALSAPARPAEPAISREPESSGTTHFNADKVSLNLDTKESSSAKLNPVSLGSTADAQTLSNVKIAPIQPTKPEEVRMAERPRYTKSWMALSLIQHGAASFDAYSTRQAVGHGAVENDPIMRPFAHSGAIYAAIQAGPIAFDLIAHRMQHSEIGVVRRFWWVPQTISTATYLFAGVHNLNVASRH